MTARRAFVPTVVLGLVGLAALLGACGRPGAEPSGAGLPSPTAGTQPTPPPSATPYRTPTTLPPLASGSPTPLPLPQGTSRFFAGSGICSACHREQTDSAGQDASIERQWAVSSMANSARNPFWQAALSAEIQGRTDQGQAVQAFCSTCHMPMAKYTANLFSAPATVLGEGFLNPKNPLHDLAMDGVSCSLCHQIGQNGLGTEDSFSGGFVIDAEAPPGSRPAFGPYETAPELSDLMTRQSGFIPIKSDHMAQSELCATCHQVVLQLDGTPSQVSPLTLQSTYLEWVQSDFRYGQSCASCHMPQAVGGAYVATQSRQPRSPFWEHSFLGGNAGLLNLLAENETELGVGYLQDLLPAAQSAQRDFMRSQAAEVEIQEAGQIGTRLQVTIAVKAKTGHKFPTGFPSRRAWIHFKVQDASGATVFESGSLAADGSIVGDNQSPGSGEFEPHYRIIDSPDKVQIYEAVLGAASGGATTRLTMAARWLKDNRLLPAGYESSGRDAPTAVVGRAAIDDDFTDGGDIVQYKLPLGGAQGPYAVTAELLYQSVTPTWIQALKDVPSSEAQRTLGFLDQEPPPVLLVDRVEAQVSP